jgi:hypothetical protein
MLRHREGKAGVATDTPNTADTLVVTVDQNLWDALGRFIHEPESRRSDVLVHRQWVPAPGLEVHWTVKHDLFAGVLMVVSIVDTEAGRVVADREKPLAQADDLLGEVTVTAGTRTWRIHVAKA